MRKLKVTFFFFSVALALSGCGIFGSSDGAAINVAEDAEAQATVNSVQAVPALTPGADTDAAEQPADGSSAPANAALPTAQTLPTAAPTPEPTVDRSQPTTYIVKSGDVLGLIAERFDADIAELRRVNGLDGNLIRVGQELTIPALDGATGTASTDPAATAAPTTPRPTSAPSAPVTCGSNATGHCIQPGDSLQGIAVKYNVTLEALRAANPGVSGDLIRSGEVLNLPGGSTAPNPVATTAVNPGGTPVPVATSGPNSNAACAAANPKFPYFHLADGLCYANPIGGTDSSGNPVCPDGRFFFSSVSNLNGTNECECQPNFVPIAGDAQQRCQLNPALATATPAASATAVVSSSDDYGSVPCRDGYLPLTTGKCWPEPSTTPATVVPTGASAATPTAVATGSTTTCSAPNFFEDVTGTCFLLQEGVDAGCTLVAGKATCP